MSQFFTLLTKTGQGLLANAIAYGQPLTIAEMAIGDGGGKLPKPDASVTRLVNEVRRGPINQTSVDANNPNWTVVEQVLPAEVGGWTIREVGLYDTDGNLIAYGNYPETYKPQLSEGAARTQTIRFVMEVTNTSAVTLRIDPSVVMASRKYVDDQLDAHAKSRNHPDADTKNKGMLRFATLAESKKGEEAKAAQTPAGGKAQLDDHRAEKEAHNASQIALEKLLDVFGKAGSVQAVLAMLGTGALKNVGNQTGELLAVGDFGIGIHPPERSCQDIDALGLIGRYYARGDKPEQFKGDHPFGAGYVLEVSTSASNNVIQTARCDATEGVAQRVYVDGWRPWEFFAGATGSLSGGWGAIKIPYFDSTQRRTLIVQMFQRQVNGPPNEKNTEITHTIRFPVAFPSRAIMVLPIGLDHPSVTEGSEVSTALATKSRTEARIKLSRSTGSAGGGPEPLLLDVLAIGE